MGQLTIYLGPDLAAKMRQAAESEGISQGLVTLTRTEVAVLPLSVLVSTTRSGISGRYQLGKRLFYLPFQSGKPNTGPKRPIS
jgi:hypothetical protein